ncbi:transporter, major facilitator family protein [Paenibacillus sp. oral taxon 786 str. D14]|uniref:MFS transporter n=1 Tax=unclassified Paenibacillus TaxID=185978 RepID=UPI0001AFD3FB|nr:MULTISPECIES: MFS transporter [unclassified Paenibacillus]EES74466.1 transporter, major facilitator family protein [Paenibacillus sp. oral taxon 786 str. D14]
MEAVEIENKSASKSPILALLALTIGAFAIGMTEFIIMGLLPEVAESLKVSIPLTGLLITGYALGVAFGAPIITIATHRMKRKQLLLFLMILFIAGNLLAALAPNYGVLMIARIVAALTHGSFFGVGSIIAAGLVPKEKRAGAIAIMFTGLTLANILGVPIGTFIGQAYGWRSTFWTITVIGLIALIGIAVLVPKVEATSSSLKQELGVLRRPAVYVALLMTTFGFGGVFTAFTYISPILTDITKFPTNFISYILVLFGVGITLGNIIGGKLADRKLMPSLLGILVVLAIVLAVFSITDQYKVPALITIFILGIAAFGTVPGLQLHMLNTAKEAPTLASTLNIAAFNLGNALGAYIGGVVIDLQFGGGLVAVPWVASIVTVAGILFTLWGAQQQKRIIRPQIFG